MYLKWSLNSQSLERILAVFPKCTQALRFSPFEGSSQIQRRVLQRWDLEVAVIYSNRSRREHTSDMSKVQIWKDCFFINRCQSWVRNWYVPEVCWFVGIFLNASHGCFKFHRAPEPYGILNDQKKGEIPWVLDDQDRRKHSTHISICIHVYVYTDIPVYPCLCNVYVCVYVYLHVYLHVYVYVCIYALCIRIYVYTSTSMPTSMSVYNVCTAKVYVTSISDR